MVPTPKVTAPPCGSVGHRAEALPRPARVATATTRLQQLAKRIANTQTGEFGFHHRSQKVGRRLFAGPISPGQTEHDLRQSPACVALGGFSIERMTQLETWTNVCVVPCVSTTGDSITVIGQTRADHAGHPRFQRGNTRCCFNGLCWATVRRSCRLKSDSFMLPDTYEIMTRR